MSSFPSTGNVFWPISAYAKSCKDREEVPLVDDSVTQITCQGACLKLGDSCVGISCSRFNAFYGDYDCSGNCYWCKNQTLVDGASGSDVFIKRPGNSYPSTCDIITN